MANGAAPFLIAEDNALKQWLKGLTVSSENGPVEVGVWFRLPEAEERRAIPPYITIDLVDISEATDRAHRGRIHPAYVPYGATFPANGFDNKTEYPIPVDLIYAVTTHTRSAWQDRQLQALLLQNKLPLRFGALLVPTEEAGVNTIRSLELIDVTQNDGLDTNQKRMFRKVYTVRVSSEMFPDAVLAVQRVGEVILDLDYQLETFVIEGEDDL